MNKRESCATKKPGIYFVARNYCEQNKILLSKEESLNEDMHLRENNDNVSNLYIVSYIIVYYFK